MAEIELRMKIRAEVVDPVGLKAYWSLRVAFSG